MPEGPKRMAEVKNQWAKDHNAQEKRQLTVSERIRGAGGGPSPTATKTSQDADGDEWATVGGRGRGGAGGNVRAAPSTSQPSPTKNSQTSRDIGNAFSALDRERRTPKASKSTTSKDEWRMKSADGAKSSTPSGRQVASEDKATEGSGVAEEKHEAEARPIAHFKKELSNVINELATSGDQEGALVRAREASAPSKYHQELVGELVGQIVQKSQSARPRLWSFLVTLASKDILRQSVFAQGVEGYLRSEKCEDLMTDVPKLPSILIEEFLSTLQAEASAFLSAKDIEQMIEMARNIGASNAD